MLTDYWRDQGTTALPIVRGTLPNLVAVPTLAFGFLMFRYPQRSKYTSSAAASQDRHFRILLVTMTLGVILWEVLQLTGKLVFDPLDLIATVVGAVGTAFAYRTLRSFSFDSH